MISVISANLCLSLCFPMYSTSIHEIEYKNYLKDAIFSPVSSTVLDYTPLQHGTRGMLKNYYGYCPYWIDTTYYGYFQMELLTHIAYFSIDIDPSDGSLGGIPNQSRFIKIRDYSHERGVKIHMTFIIFGSSNVTIFLNNAIARLNAINNISNFITNYGIEGANIDFEFVTASVRDSFNLFINDLANALWNHPNGRKELYIATIAVPEWYPGYDIAYVSEHSDGLFIMGYDFHWSGSSVAGPVSPCVPSAFWGQYCVAKSIGSYKAYGVSGSRIILGLPYYGYDWPTVSGDVGSSTTGTGTAVIYYYAFQNAITYGRLWDDYSLTPWYRYYTTEWHQCWYDDSVSLDIKYGMVNDSLLQGAGCWALGYDRDYDHLWNTIRRNFWIEPPTRHFTAEVMLADLNIRDGPGNQYNILTTADSGSKFVSFDYYNYWYKIYFPSKSGPYYAWAWAGDGIDYQYMRGTTQNTVLRVTANLLNVREGPGTTYPIITQIANGQVFVADSFEGDWARIYLPLINGHTNGWICYTFYTNVIQNPEDYNNYDCELIELDYPSYVQALDTFSVIFKIKNTGYGPFDSLVYLKGNEPSPFYYANTWQDSTRAKTFGFNGLPNQTFYINSIFRSPNTADTAVVSDTFSFERNGTLFGPQIIVTVTVTAIAEQQAVFIKDKFRITNTIFARELKLNLQNFTDCEIKIYDILGRKLLDIKNRGEDVVKIGGELQPGVYFLIIKNKDIILKEKIVKIRI